jgi:hypothetical protein
MFSTGLSLTLCIVGAALLATLGAVRMHCRPARKAIIISLRLCALGAILLLFFQPTLRFRQLAPLHDTTAILIDASASMRLFGTDSAMAALNRLFPDTTGKHDGRTQFFLFGDSLRPQDRRRPVLFADSRSRFPRGLDAAGLKSARNLVVLSDGNWSNTSIPQALFADKNVRYVMLDEPQHLPFLDMQAGISPDRVIRGKPSSVSIDLSGYCRTGNIVRITVRRGTNIIARRVKTVTAGFFNDTALLPLPTDSIGTCMYSITATSDDSIAATRYAVLTTVRDRFGAFIYGIAPTLDRRSVTLTLAKRGWTTTDARYADILFLFDWDAHAERLLDSLNPAGTAVFVGAAPCPDQRAKAVLRFRPMLQSAGFDQSLISRLSPPTAIVMCTTPPWRMEPAIASAEVQLAGDSVTRTLPLLFEALFAKRMVLVLAARGIWRWDFSGADDGPTEGATTFSDLFFSRLEELAQRNAGRSLYAYPENAPCRETDSVRFRLALPFSPATDEGTLRFTLTGPKNDTVFDTTLTRAAGLRRLTIAPHPAGVYRYSCRASSSTLVRVAADSLPIVPDDSEMRITGQNRLLLDQLGTPLDLRDGVAVNGMRGNQVSAGQTTTSTREFPITQSWPLLLLIFALLGSEWFVRKAWKVEV